MIGKKTESHEDHWLHSFAACCGPSSMASIPVFYDHIDPNSRAVNLIDLYLAPLSSHLCQDKIKEETSRPREETIVKNASHPPWWWKKEEEKKRAHLFWTMYFTDSSLLTISGIWMLFFSFLLEHFAPYWERGGIPLTFADNVRESVCVQCRDAPRVVRSCAAI